MVTHNILVTADAIIHHSSQLACSNSLQLVQASDLQEIGNPTTSIYTHVLVIRKICRPRFSWPHSAVIERVATSKRNESFHLDREDLLTCPLTRLSSQGKASPHNWETSASFQQLSLRFIGCHLSTFVGKKIAHGKDLDYDRSRPQKGAEIAHDRPWFQN